MKAVIFDLMGTLAFVQNPTHPFRQLLDRSRADSAAELAMTSSAPSCIKLAKEIGSNLTPAEAIELETLVLAESERMEIFPEVKEALGDLKSRGFTVIVSSNNLRPYARAKYLLKGYVDYWNFSFDTGILKPDPEAFLGPLRAYGLTPSKCLVVGDSMATDGAGARAAGIPFVLLDRFDRNPMVSAIKDLSQLKSITS